MVDFGAFESVSFITKVKSGNQTEKIPYLHKRAERSPKRSSVLSIEPVVEILSSCYAVHQIYGGIIVVLTYASMGYMTPQAETPANEPHRNGTKDACRT
jgi:hypothetical protein